MLELLTCKKLDKSIVKFGVKLKNLIFDLGIKGDEFLRKKEKRHFLLNLNPVYVQKINSLIDK